MSTRHESRKLLMQTMYELDINGDISNTEAFVRVLKRNLRQEEEDKQINAVLNTQVKDKDEYLETLATIVRERCDTVDNIISKAAPEWPLEKINVVDRNVLRIGLTELLFGERFSVPPKVAIDEAIEIAKEYGGETSGKFVNGVMGAVYKDLGEPGKDGVKKSEKKTTLTKNKVGAFIFIREDDGISVAMVKDIFGYWTMLKVDSKATAKTEKESELVEGVKIELGLDTKVISSLGVNSYVAHNPEKGNVGKSISYFIVESASESKKEMHIANDGGLMECRWFKLDELSDLRTYKDLKSLISRAIEDVSNL